MISLNHTGGKQYNLSEKRQVFLLTLNINLSITVDGHLRLAEFKQQMQRYVNLAI